MPSFFEGLKRLINGQPVFNVNDSTPPRAAPPQVQPQPSGGSKVIPQVFVERTECEERGTGMHCEITIQNYSQAHATLQRIELLGQTKELGQVIDPGEEYELVWDFPQRPNSTMYNDCNLYYKDTQTTDAFCSRHMVEFEAQGDNTFTIRHIKFFPPIRDV